MGDFNARYFHLLTISTIQPKQAVEIAVLKHAGITCVFNLPQRCSLLEERQLAAFTVTAVLLV